eukprot:2121706-Rhodomonas_salina.3
MRCLVLTERMILRQELREQFIGAVRDKAALQVLLYCTGIAGGLAPYGIGLHARACGCFKHQRARVLRTRTKKQRVTVPEHMKTTHEHTVVLSTSTRAHTLAVVLKTCTWFRIAKQQHTRTLPCYSRLSAANSSRRSSRASVLNSPPTLPPPTQTRRRRKPAAAAARRRRTAGCRR